MYDPIHDTMVPEATSEATAPQPDQPEIPPAEEEDQPQQQQQHQQQQAAQADEAAHESAPQPVSTPAPDGEKLSTATKHVLAPTPRTTPSKRTKRSRGGNNKGVNVLSSARSRHLKKEDGQPFWRKDIQYAFLRALFDNDVKAFTDPFPDSPDQVNMDDRAHDPEGRLSFAELYIKTISHSSKCSKVLKERLLNDMKMSIPTCMICLLVNVGRMNTTINFVPDMKSQLRTYHPIPSLQVNYDSETTGNDKSNDKQLQDTPRLKSILKACCDDTHEPQELYQLETLDRLPITTVVNMIFVLCNTEIAVMRKFFVDVPYHFFDIFVNSEYEPKSRSDLFLWLLYNYLETHMADEEIAKNPFGATKPVLKTAVIDYDVDSPLELEFGERLHDQRVKYLDEEGPDKPPLLRADGTMTWKLNGQPEPKNGTNPKRSKSLDGNDGSPNVTEGSAETQDELSLQAEHNHDSSVQVKDEIKQENGESIPDENKPHVPLIQPTKKVVSASASHSHAAPAPQPALRQDIDVANVRKVVKGLRHKSHKRRVKMGPVRFQDFLIHREGTVDDDASNRLRLKNYKGDYAEYHTKFYKAFTNLKDDFLELTTTKGAEPVKGKVEYSYADDGSESLKLTNFDIGSEI